MSKTTDIAVIGAGAAGYAAAITAAREGAEVLLVDVGDKTCRKVLASGNGRCNLSNREISSSRYVTRDPALLAGLLQGSEEIVSRFFDDLGVLVAPDEAGRLYPWSNRASSVVDALILAASEAGVKRSTATIKGISPAKGGYLIDADGVSLFARSVILAVGSPASPSVGGRANEWIADLGCEIVPFTEGLVALKTDKKYFSLKGVRVRCVASLLSEGVCLAKEEGEVLFGETSLSGIVSMQLSMALPQSGAATIALDLLPSLSVEALASMLAARSKEGADKIFVGLVDKPVAYQLLKEEGIPLSASVADLTPSQLRALAARAKRWTFGVAGTVGLEAAQVAKGGIRLSSLDRTLQFKSHPGLFAAGEVVDVTGFCGGYNLHWAWLSGVSAARGALSFCHLT